MTMWEYMKYLETGRLQLEARDSELNKLGLAGWEAYHVEHVGGETVYFLKRQV